MIGFEVTPADSSVNGYVAVRLDKFGIEAGSEAFAGLIASLSGANSGGDDNSGLRKDIADLLETIEGLAEQDEKDGAGEDWDTGVSEEEIERAEKNIIWRGETAAGNPVTVVIDYVEETKSGEEAGDETSGAGAATYVIAWYQSDTSDKEVESCPIYCGYTVYDVNFTGVSLPAGRDNGALDAAGAQGERGKKNDAMGYGIGSSAQASEYMAEAVASAGESFAGELSGGGDAVVENANRHNGDGRAAYKDGRKDACRDFAEGARRGDEKTDAVVCETDLSGETDAAEGTWAEGRPAEP